MLTKTSTGQTWSDATDVDGIESIEDAFDADINIGAAASGQQTVTQTGDLEANHFYFLTDEDDNTLTIPDDAVAIMIGIGKGNVARIRVEDLLNETEVTDGQEANELGIRLSAFALGKGTANISDQILIGHGSSRELAIGTTGDDVDGTPLIIQWVYSVSVSVIGAASTVGIQDLTDSSTIDWTLDHTKTASVTLGGNRTISNPSGGIDGGTYKIIITQDSTGNRIVTWGSDFNWGDAGSPTLSTGSNDSDILTFIRVGGEMWFMNIAKGF